MYTTFRDQINSQKNTFFLVQYVSFGNMSSYGGVVDCKQCYVLSLSCTMPLFTTKSPFFGLWKGGKYDTLMASLKIIEENV